jgi:hypothetical protein
MRIGWHNYRLLLLVLVFALPAASASAQMSPELSFPTQKQQKQLTPEQQKYQKDLDENYNAANKKIPDKRSLGHDAIGADSFGIKEEAAIRRQACDGAALK